MASTGTDLYPYSDGKIMAETGWQVEAILDALATLRIWSAHQDRVQVGANMFVYYQEGDPSKRVTPELFVVRGLKALPEPCYKLWEEGRPPTFVLEVASPYPEERDRGKEQALYASMGVAEYWRFAPKGFLKDRAGPRKRLMGGALRGLGYEPLESAADGSIRSVVLGLDVRVDERPKTSHLLRFRDPETGQDLLTFSEAQEAQIEAQRRQQEVDRDQCEAESRLREAAASRREAERARREAESSLREETARRREAERAQREATTARRDAEMEVARLRAEVARLKSGQGGGSGSMS